MHDIFFYIFAAITILTVLFMAFSGGRKSPLVYFTYFIGAECGLLILSNSQLISLLISLFLLMLFFIIFLFKEKLEVFIDSAGSKIKTTIFSLLIISLLTAILTSLLGNARWQKAIIDAGLNSFVLIFTKYLPLILAMTLLLSVLIPVFTRILKQSETVN